MDDKTLAALEESIKHWREFAQAEKPSDVNINADDCALCHLYLIPYRADAKKRCKGCPVDERSGYSCGAGTPYLKASESLDDWLVASDAGYDDGSEKHFKEVANEMVDFLVSLRPQKGEDS